MRSRIWVAPTLDELTDFLRNQRHIANQKPPELPVIIDQPPTTTTGKVQKVLLREMARALAEQVN